MSVPGRSAGAGWAILALLLAAAVVPRLLGGGEAPRPPDIVLVVWDTGRADRLSCQGGHRPTTPRLDAFAQGAVRFARCFAPAPWTAPSHGSLFTGLMPSGHGLRVGRGDPIPPSIPLLAETLARHGYDTVGVSANPLVSPLLGLSRGFRSFEFADSGTEIHDAALVERVAGDALDRRAADPSAREKPLFLFLNFMDLHLPHRPPPEAAAALGPGRIPAADLERASRLGTEEGMATTLGEGRVDRRTAEALKFLYDADLRYLDRVTARLFEDLWARGILDRALVVVTSDHGDNLGEHGLLGHRLSLLDTLLHVPLVVRFPGEFEGGRVVEEPVSLMDVYPTILRAAGVEPPPGTGLDARPLRAAGGGDPGRALLAEHGPHGIYLDDSRALHPEAAPEAFEPLRWMFQAARSAGGPDARYKLVRIRRQEDDGRFTPAGRALYDLLADPGEARDLLAGGGDPGAREAADRLEKALPDPTVPAAPR